MKVAYLKQKYKRSEVYKGVLYRINRGQKIWYAHTSERHKECTSERHAAITYDMWRIENNKKPINVLKQIT